jgi:DNA-binding NtrC family response regulator
VGGTSPVATDVRVIAATNRNLRQMVAERLFRSDLFYRLNVMTIHVPALRQRREDMEQLVSHILARLSFELGIPRPPLGREVMARFAEYSWPGNVRELENVLERLLVVSQDRTVGLGDLPPEIRLGAAVTRGPPRRSRRAAPDGRPAIRARASMRSSGTPSATYEACGQSPSRTAQVLGLSCARCTIAPRVPRRKGPAHAAPRRHSQPRQRRERAFGARRARGRRRLAGYWRRRARRWHPGRPSATAVLPA